MDRPASLEERAALARRLAEPAQDRGHTFSARYEEQATEAQQAARVVRDLLEGPGG